MVSKMCNGLVMSALGLCAASAVANTSATLTISGYIPNTTEITFDEVTLASTRHTALTSLTSLSKQSQSPESSVMPYQVVSNVDYTINVEYFERNNVQNYELGVDTTSQHVSFIPTSQSVAGVTPNTQIKVSIAAL